LLVLGLAACSAPPAPAPQAPAPAPKPTRPDDPPPPPQAPALTDSDCAVVKTAPAIGVAVVTESRTDCSSVGGRWVVLEVKHLARGEKITLAAIRLPLHDRKLQVGDTVVAALEPIDMPSKTVYCVALPAFQASLSRAVTVDSFETGKRLADAIAAGRTCPP
jgi:hypothetical protein